MVLGAPEDGWKERAPDTTTRLDDHIERHPDRFGATWMAHAAAWRSSSSAWSPATSTSTAIP
ncbi:MAG: hypothetical protein GEV28_09500 [Actinophytocola sp.]|uniref:hypothetical protein n=1 Tax=Actinophytocola sp. TaxID=1872138 RepID=UPI00132C4914|nr:hypothetical protein [Actinophytocola sp.]MPZ80606.1 hypothetical protein [Actinophytocola sp.]